MSEKEMVNHPSHYQSETGLEVIKVIEAFTFDLTGIEAWDTGNIIKYICRWKKKNGIEDLKKVKWYVEDLIEHVEKLDEGNKELIDTFCNSVPACRSAVIGIHKNFECKHCGRKFFCFDQEDLEEELWGHIQLKHPERFKECEDFETPAMVEENYITKEI